jgi:hypothetical protein
VDSARLPSTAKIRRYGYADRHGPKIELTREVLGQFDVSDAFSRHLVKFHHEMYLDKFLDFLKEYRLTHGLIIFECQSYTDGRLVLAVDNKRKIEGIREIPPPEEPTEWLFEPSLTLESSTERFEALPDFRSPPSDEVAVPTEQPIDKRMALAALVVALEHAKRAADEVDQKAAEARSAGATWTEVGEAAGISMQAAHQRWAPGARERHAERQQAWMDKKRTDAVAGDA